MVAGVGGHWLNCHLITFLPPFESTSQIPCGKLVSAYLTWERLQQPPEREDSIQPDYAWSVCSDVWTDMRLLVMAWKKSLKSPPPTQSFFSFTIIPKLLGFQAHTIVWFQKNLTPEFWILNRSLTYQWLIGRRDNSGVTELRHQFVCNLVVGGNSLPLNFLAHLHGEMPQTFSSLVPLFTALPGERERERERKNEMNYASNEGLDDTHRIRHFNPNISH